MEVINSTDGSNTCIACGRDIYEDRQVCFICEHKATSKPDVVKDRRMTKKEIIEANECCILGYDKSCEECPLYPDDAEIACREILREETFDLLKEVLGEDYDK